MENYSYLQEFSEYAIKEEASKAAKTLVIRSYDNGSSVDIRRDATPEEAKIIENTIYGALLTIRNRTTTQDNTHLKETALSVAEYIADLSLPDINGYLTVYNPALRILNDLETVSLRAKEIKSEYYYNGYNIDRTLNGEWLISHNNKTVAYEDGDIFQLKKSLSEHYISADDIRVEDAEKQDTDIQEMENSRFDDDIEQETITTLLNTFPDYVLSKDFSNNCVIIKWGKAGYYETDYPKGAYTDEVIDELNENGGIVKAQRFAMEACAIAAQNNEGLDWKSHYQKCLKMYMQKNQNDEPILFPSNGRK